MYRLWCIFAGIGLRFRLGIAVKIHYFVYFIKNSVIDHSAFVRVIKFGENAVLIQLNASAVAVVVNVFSKGHNSTQTVVFFYCIILNIYKFHSVAQNFEAEHGVLIGFANVAVELRNIIIGDYELFFICKLDRFVRIISEWPFRINYIAFALRVGIAEGLWRGIRTCTVFFRISGNAGGKYQNRQNKCNRKKFFHFIVPFIKC